MVTVWQDAGRKAPGLLPFAVVVPIWFVPSKTCTVLLAAAVPVSVSVLSLVIPSPTVPLSVENEAIVGALGATVSTVTVSGGDGELVVPPLVAVAVKLWVAFNNVPVV